MIEIVDLTVAGSEGVSGLSLGARPGETLALLGPAGCGGSAVLAAIAGLVTPAAGAIVIGGRRIDNLAPRARPVGLVLPGLALWPHMTVGESIAFALKVRGVGTAGQVARVAEVMRLIDLAPATVDRSPRTLGPADRLRVALGRALAAGPEVLLLDHALAGVGPGSAVADMLGPLCAGLGIALIVATDDPCTALGLADRVAVLRAGRLVQEGSVGDLHDRPVDAEVAALGGPVNLLPVTVTGADAQAIWVSAPELGEGWLPLSQASLAVRPGPGLLMVRPDRVRLVEDEGVPALMVAWRRAGGRWIGRADIARGIPMRVEIDAADLLPAEPGQEVMLSWASTDAYLLPGAVG